MALRKFFEKGSKVEKNEAGSRARQDEATIADAILDRIIPKANRIELKGKSLRKSSKHIS